MLSRLKSYTAKVLDDQKQQEMIKIDAALDIWNNNSQAAEH